MQKFFKFFLCLCFCLALCHSALKDPVCGQVHMLAKHNQKPVVINLKDKSKVEELIFTNNSFTPAFEPISISSLLLPNLATNTWYSLRAGLSVLKIIDAAYIFSMEMLDDYLKENPFAPLIFAATNMALIIPAYQVGVSLLTIMHEMGHYNSSKALGLEPNMRIAEDNNLSPYSPYVLNFFNFLMHKLIQGDQDRENYTQAWFDSYKLHGQDGLLQPKTQGLDDVFLPDVQHRGFLQLSNVNKIIVSAAGMNACSQAVDNMERDMFFNRPYARSWLVFLFKMLLLADMWGYVGDKLNTNLHTNYLGKDDFFLIAQYYSQENIYMDSKSKKFLLLPIIVGFLNTNFYNYKYIKFNLINNIKMPTLVAYLTPLGLSYYVNMGYIINNNFFIFGLETPIDGPHRGKYKEFNINYRYYWGGGANYINFNAHMGVRGFNLESTVNFLPLNNPFFSVEIGGARYDSETFFGQRHAVNLLNVISYNLLLSINFLPNLPNASLDQLPQHNNPNRETRLTSVYNNPYEPKIIYNRVQNFYATPQIGGVNNA